jgi:hypothetical protein
MGEFYEGLAEYHVLGLAAVLRNLEEYAIKLCQPQLVQTSFYLFRSRSKKALHHFRHPFPVLRIRSRSLSRKELHQFRGAGAIPRCGSGFDGTGSKHNVQHKWIIKNVKSVTVFTFLNYICNYFNHKKSEETLGF